MSVHSVDLGSACVFEFDGPAEDSCGVEEEARRAFSGELDIRSRLFCSTLGRHRARDRVSLGQAFFDLFFNPGSSSDVSGPGVGIN